MKGLHAVGQHDMHVARTAVVPMPLTDGGSLIDDPRTRGSQICCIHCQGSPVFGTPAYVSSRPRRAMNKAHK